MQLTDYQYVPQTVDGSSLQSIIIPSGTKYKFARFLPDNKDKLVEQ